MPDTTKSKTQEEASETRPTPSQAEGDEETVDESLKQKEEKERQ